MSGAYLIGKFLAFFTNIRIGWKGLLGTNAPTYYENS